MTAHLGSTLVPEPVAAREGGWIVGDGGHTWRRGVGSPAWPSATRRCRSCDPRRNLLGRFHAALADLAPDRLVETLPRFHDPSGRLARLVEAVDNDPVGRAAGDRPEIDAAAAPPLGQPRRRHRRPRSAPCRAQRRAARQFLFRGDDAVCLLDLDTVMGTAWFWDVGDLVRTAAAPAAEDDPDPDTQRGAAGTSRCDPRRVSRGRRRRARNPAAPRSEALDVAGAIVTYEQALRFLTDWLARRRLLPDRAGPSRTCDRARAQLALLASLTGTVPARDAFPLTRPLGACRHRRAVPARHRRRPVARRARRRAVRARAAGGRCAATRRPGSSRPSTPTATAHIRLLVVDPDARGRGLGPRAVRRGRSRRARPRAHVGHVGADAPYFLWPGVPTLRDRAALSARAAPLRPRSKPTST